VVEEARDWIDGKCSRIGRPGHHSRPSVEGRRAFPCDDWSCTTRWLSGGYSPPSQSGADHL